MPETMRRSQAATIHGNDPDVSPWEEMTGTTRRATERPENVPLINTVLPASSQQQREYSTKPSIFR